MESSHVLQPRMSKEPCASSGVNMLAEDWSGEVTNVSYKLTNSQVVRLLGMIEVLRIAENLEQISEIKLSLSTDHIDDARGMWSDFTDAERKALWVAPLYGGIFTTEERKQLKPATTE